MRAVLLTAALPLLAGCLAAETRPLWNFDLPQAYREAPKGKAAHGAPPKVEWWRDFRSAELTRLMEDAGVGNLDIAVAVARIIQADAQAQIAGAPLLPQVDAHASATRSQSSLATGNGNVSGSRQHRLFSASLTASYEIDFWGKNRALLTAAAENAVAARYNRDVVALSTFAAVANAYFQVLAAQDRLRIARENVASASRILGVIRQRLDVGTVSDLDIAQQESLLATQRAAIPQLEQTLRQTINVLAVLVGRPPEFVNIAGGSMNRIAIPRVTPGLPSELLIQRPDIQMAEAHLASASANVYAARAAFFPSIQLTAEGGYQSAALKTLFTPQAAFYNAAVSLTQPVFDGFRLQGQLKLQRGLEEETLQTYRKSVISAFSDVENALIAIRETAERERLLRDAVASSRRAFDLSERRLREGTIDLVTLLTAQQTLFQNQDALSQARLLRLQAIVSLYQALGGGWEPRIELGHAR
jgi:NodT family efflux transporter outer membrane factor (OMF) lipoprotein